MISDHKDRFFRPLNITSLNDALNFYKDLLAKNRLDEDDKKLLRICQSKLAGYACEFILFRKSIEVENLLNMHPEILFCQGLAKNYSGNTYEGSPFQCALGEKNINLLNKMKTYIPLVKGGIEKAKEQFCEKYPKLSDEFLFNENKVENKHQENISELKSKFLTESILNKYISEVILYYYLIVYTDRDQGNKNETTNDILLEAASDLKSYYTLLKALPEAKSINDPELIQMFNAGMNYKGGGDITFLLPSLRRVKEKIQELNYIYDSKMELSGEYLTFLKAGQKLTAEHGALLKAMGRKLGILQSDPEEFLNFLQIDLNEFYQLARKKLGGFEKSSEIKMNSYNFHELARAISENASSIKIINGRYVADEIKALNDFKDTFKSKGAMKTGEHFNLQILIDACLIYCYYHNGWNDSQRNLFLAQVVGLLERDTIEILLRYTQDQTTESTRSLELGDRPNIFPLDEKSNNCLGLDFGICANFVRKDNVRTGDIAFRVAARVGYVPPHTESAYATYQFLTSLQMEKTIGFVEFKEWLKHEFKEVLKHKQDCNLVIRPSV